MALVTLLSMRERAIRAADAEGTIDPALAADKAYTDPIINSALGRLHDLLTESFEDYHLNVSSAVVVSGAATTFTLTSASITNLLKLRSLERQRLDLKYDDVERISLGERNRRIERGYFIAQDTVHLYPSEKAVGTYRVWYTPGFSLLVADTGPTGSYETINGWEEIAVVDAARQFKADLEKDTSELQRRYDELRAHVMNVAKQRNAHGPRKVRKVRWTIYDQLLSSDIERLP